MYLKVNDPEEYNTFDGKVKIALGTTYDEISKVYFIEFRIHDRDGLIIRRFFIANRKGILNKLEKLITEANNFPPTQIVSHLEYLTLSKR